MQRLLNRRAFAGSLGAGLAATIFGGGQVEGLGRVVIAQQGDREFHSAWPYVDPGAGGHFNAFVANGIMNPPNIYGDLMYAPMALLYWASNEWLPVAAESWEFLVTGDGLASPEASPSVAVATPVPSESGRILSVMEAAVDPNVDTLRVYLREGVMWSDGTQLSSRDVVDTFDILRLQGNTAWEYLEEVSAVDNLTVDFLMSSPSTVVERYALRRSPMPSSVYGEFAQRARDLVAAGETPESNAWSQLVNEFNEYRPDAPVVNGPFTIDVSSITNAQFTMPKNEGSYWADRVDFDRIINFNGETDTISAVVLNKDIDYATHGFPPSTQAAMQEQGIRILRPPTYAGPCLKFNYRALPHFSDKRVRQAIAHVLDRSVIGTVALGEAGVPVKYMAGIADNLVEQWLDEVTIAKFNPYDVDLERATALLEEAGWSKDGERWMMPDGEPASFEVIHGAEQADLSAVASQVVEQLGAFGFEMTQHPITFVQMGPDITAGRFQMAVYSWGSSGNPHPHYSYTNAFFAFNARSESDVERGMDFPLLQQTDVMGEVDIEQLVLATGEGMDVDEQRARIADAAVVHNELQHQITIYEFHGINPGLEGVRVREWPADDDPILLNSPYADGIPTMLMYAGELDPVE